MPSYKTKPILPLTDRDIARFHKFVEVAGPDECWPWKGCCNWMGYGIFRISALRGNFQSHRIALCIATGKDPGDLCAMHSCDNPQCNNPKHLSAGTDSENARDARKKGKMLGEKNGHSLLTEAIVLRIRRDADKGMSYAAMGTKYGIWPRTAHRIVTRGAWKHVK